MPIFVLENNAIEFLVKEKVGAIAIYKAKFVAEIRSKLETNLPTASLAVKSNKGIVTVAGMVGIHSQLERIETLAREINGVNGVEIRAVVTPQ